VIWPHTRDEQSFELETRYDENTPSYLVIWRHPDGTSRTESFPDHARFKERLMILEQQLTGDGWHFTGSPCLLATGWASAKPAAES
jgi:hypothetical protein